jgi:hypothetical protein
MIVIVPNQMKGQRCCMEMEPLLKLYKVNVYQESCGIVRLYNFIVSNHVEPLKPSNQMSTVTKNDSLISILEPVVTL